MINATMLIGRKPALIAGGAGALLVPLLLATPVVLAFAGQNTERDAIVHRLGVYRAEIALKPGLERQLALARQRAASTQGLIVSASAPLAEAQLQNEMKAIVATNAGEIRSAQIMPAASTNGFESVTVRYDVAIPITHLRELLYAVETHTPYLFIDDATIDMPQYWQSSQAGEPKLEVRWTVHGYRWAGSK